MNDRITFLESSIANLEAVKYECLNAGRPIPDWIIYKLGELKSELEAEKNRTPD